MYELVQVDAFTRTRLEGNPCAVIFDADDLSAAQMQAIAREMNLSETAFVMASDVADFRARYFTPAEEIPLAGHPTVSVAHALRDTGRHAGESLSLQLQVGVIQVETRGDVHMMTQQPPRFMATYDPEDVVDAFNLFPDDVLPGYPIQTVSTGTPQLMVPVRDLGALRRAAVAVGRYKQLRAEADFFSPHLFVVGGLTDEGDTFARHFGVPPDVMEDPFTGSATGGMAAYLWHYGLIESPTFIAEQGHWQGRPGRGHVEVVGPRDAIETVRIGGPAVTVMQGRLWV